MDIGNPYILVIAVSCVIILSFFFSEIARRTNIPSVLLLVALGVGVKEYLDLIQVDTGPQLFRLLELLGIVGLIMIVLEAALDLRLAKEKSATILRALFVALLTLGVTSFLVAYIFHTFLGMTLFASLIYAIPVSVLSSAIVIPSVAQLADVKKEFLVYESTFSDILGIMFFNIAVTTTAVKSAASISLEVALNLGLSTILALVISYALITLFQRISGNVKLFFLIAVLVALYSAAKMLDLSALVIILIFGLVLKNEDVFFRGRLQTWIDPSVLREIVENFHVVTRETSFVVRTLFFVVFGMTLTLSTLLDVDMAILSLGVLISIYAVRYLSLLVARVPNVRPELFVAPRGLITILLFFAIPPGLVSLSFDPAIVLSVIIATNLIMTYGLIVHGKETAWVRKLSFEDWPSMDKEIEELRQKGSGES